MKISKTVGIIFIVLIAGFLLGFILKNNSQKNGIGNTSNDLVENVNETTIDTKPVNTKIPTPTFAPVGTIVKSKTSDTIIIENTGIKDSTFTISKSVSGIKYFKNSSGNLIPASFDDVKIGQKVTLKIIKPGIEAQFIIEL
jgi:hypothetical protein